MPVFHNDLMLVIEPKNELVADEINKAVSLEYLYTWLLSNLVVILVLRWVMWDSMGCYGSSEYPWGICRGPSMASLVPQSRADGESSAF